MYWSLNEKFLQKFDGVPCEKNGSKTKYRYVDNM